MQKFTPCLLFVGQQCGHAEEAIRRYVSVFPRSTIDRLERHGPGGPETEGTLKGGRFALGGQELLAMDSAVDHRFPFTPAVSIFARCESEVEFDSVFGELSQGGDVKMPPGNYGFSRKFAWFDDRFGVSWQSNLPD
jgi:predicted 3-demethylubiquinone-9 3-methyltransferase (glyoxalase superfamily)